MKEGETVRLKAWKWKVDEKEKMGRIFFSSFEVVHLSDLERQQRKIGRKMAVERS